MSVEPHTTPISWLDLYSHFPAKERVDKLEVDVHEQSVELVEVRTTMVAIKESLVNLTATLTWLGRLVVGAIVLDVLSRVFM